MLKVLIGGVAVGLANIIPGVSGGTMMVILGLFNQVMESISGLFKKDMKKNFKKNVTFLAVLGVGAIIGLVVFAKLLEYLFANFPIQTLFSFVGMVAFSIPSLKKKEMSNDKFKIVPILLGAAVIFLISFFAPVESDVVITEFPSIDILYILLMLVCGIVAGGAMFVPGVSGSMLLLIFGQYYLFKSLVAEVTSFQFDVLIPLGFMGLGILLGIVLSSKLTRFCLKKNHEFTMNFIMGLVISSSIVLIPFADISALVAVGDVANTLVVLGTSLLSLLFGGAIVILLEKLA
ncbi:MAG: DUF368 domain-containing protein [Clostridia bacterium]